MTKEIESQSNHQPEWRPDWIGTEERIFIYLSFCLSILSIVHYYEHFVGKFL